MAGKLIWGYKNDLTPPSYWKYKIQFCILYKNEARTFITWEKWLSWIQNWEMPAFPSFQKLFCARQGARASTSNLQIFSHPLGERWKSWRPICPWLPWPAQSWTAESGFRFKAAGLQMTDLPLFHKTAKTFARRGATSCLECLSWSL